MTTKTSEAGPPREQSIPPGTPIEVWNRSVQRWSGGFELVGWAEGGCSIRRQGAPDDVLPALFRAGDVRNVDRRTRFR